MAICRTKRETAISVTACPVAGKTLSRIVYRWVVNDSCWITRAFDNDRYAKARESFVFVGLFVNGYRDIEMEHIR